MSEILLLLCMCSASAFMGFSVFLYREMILCKKSMESRTCDFMETLRKSSDANLSQASKISELEDKVQAVLSQNALFQSQRRM